MPKLYPYKGVMLDARTLAMMQMVDRLTPTISVQPAQGGYNPGGVAASAGTHDRAAIDLKTKHLVAAQKTALERVMEAVGFAVWFRPYNWNGRGGGEHLHAVPIGGDLSAGAQGQVKAYKVGRDGLVRNRRYPRPKGWKVVVWEQYLAAHQAAKTTTSLAQAKAGPVISRGWRRTDKPYAVDKVKVCDVLSVAALNRALAADKAAPGGVKAHTKRDDLTVKIVLASLYRVGLVTQDYYWRGIAGATAQEALDKFRHWVGPSRGWTERDMTGPVGKATLEMLFYDAGVIVPRVID